MPRPPAPADYDEVIVYRVAVRNEHPGGPLSAGDVAEIVRRMAAAGYSDGQIAYRIGYHARSVLRVRRAHNIPSPYPPQGCNRATLRHPEAPSRRDRAARERDIHRNRRISRQ